MPRFEVEIPHSLATADVRGRLQRAQRKLEEEYGATCRWEGDTLLVERKGLAARVKVEEQRILVACDLGFLMGPMAGTIKAGITKRLTQLLSAP